MQKIHLRQFDGLPYRSNNSIHNPMCKVLIIGAGPAGTSCAIQLLKAGINVTLFDRKNFPRQVPGETLHPGVEPLLYQLGVLENVHKENFIRHKGVVTEYLGEKTFDAYNEAENWFGFQLFRCSFDAILLHKAISLGGKFFTTDIVDINLDKNNAVRSIKTKAGDFESDFVIDATGQYSFLNRKLKIGYKFLSPRLLACYGYVSNTSTNNRLYDNPRMIWNSKSWTWIAKVQETLIAWNRVGLFEDMLPIKCVPEELNDQISVGNTKAVDVSWRIANHVSKNNYFLVGDAAFLLDPSSSHGVLKAIMSGMMVASLIGKINLNQICEFEACEYYSRWMEKWYEEDVQKLKLLYKDKGVDLSLIHKDNRRVRKVLHPWPER